jgi:predicted acylesterase/phospholipase RssA
MLKDTKNIVLSGGGINGLCHVGALRAIQSLLDVPIFCHFHGFAGTSIGSLLCLGLVCSCTVHTIYKYFKQFKSQLDCMINSNDAIRSFYPIDTMIDLILPFHDISFAQLFFHSKKHLIIVATNISTVQIQYFDHIGTPNVQVKHAILASMAIPGLLPPVSIGNSLYVDGGIALNFPFCAFTKKNTIGLCLQNTNRGSFQKTDILENSLLFFKIIGLSFYYTQDMQLQKQYFPKYRHRIIIIPAPIVIPFATNVDSIFMQQQGFMAAFIHFYRYKEFTQDYTLLNTLRHGLLLYYRPFLQQQINTVFVLIILFSSFTFVRIQNKKNNFL